MNITLFMCQRWWFAPLLKAYLVFLYVMRARPNKWFIDWVVRNGVVTTIKS